MLCNECGGFTSKERIESQPPTFPYLGLLKPNTVKNRGVPAYSFKRVMLYEHVERVKIMYLPFKNHSHRCNSHYILRKNSL